MRRMRFRNDLTAIQRADGTRYHITCCPINAYQAEVEGGRRVLAGEIMDEDVQEICLACWEPLLGLPRDPTT